MTDKVVNLLIGPDDDNENIVAMFSCDKDQPPVVLATISIPLMDAGGESAYAAWRSMIQLFVTMLVGEPLTTEKVVDDE